MTWKWIDTNIKHKNAAVTILTSAKIDIKATALSKIKRNGT